MIAFFQLALPTTLLVLADEALPPLETHDELAGLGPVKIIVHPPYRSQRSASVFQVGNEEPLFRDIDKLNPVDPQPVEAMVEIDGAHAIRCDAIAVEIHRDDFPREIGKRARQPLLELACQAADGVLRRIRVLTRASHLKPLEPDSVVFRLVFLDDERQRLPPSEGKFVETGNLSFQIQHVALTPKIWDAVVAMGEYETPPWEELLLDASDVDIEIGPALVLAATAVETRIANALDLLSIEKVPGDVWQWATTRRDDFTKTPSVSEQLDELLAALGGRSLREDTRLWKAGVELRDARNSFVHEGRAMSGKRNRKRKRQPVTRGKARELVTAAGEIIDFIEALLPEGERRPRLEVTPTVTTTVMLQARTEEALAEASETDH